MRGSSSALVFLPTPPLTQPPPLRAESGVFAAGNCLVLTASPQSQWATWAVGVSLWVFLALHLRPRRAQSSRPRSEHGLRKPGTINTAFLKVRERKEILFRRNKAGTCTHIVLSICSQERRIERMRRPVSAGCFLACIIWLSKMGR